MRRWLEQRWSVIVGALAFTVLASIAQVGKVKMVTIPAGECLMGTAERQADNLAKRFGVQRDLFALELPQRAVFVEASAIDRYEVTNRQYLDFVKATGHRPPHHYVNGSYPEGLGEHPVVHVDWQDTHDYVKWVGKRLPTQAEWEKAARGPAGRTYPWGDDWVEEACNMDDGRLSTVPVGSFAQDRSAYGVADMAGNLAEWVSTPSAEDPRFRFVKGGSFIHSQPHNFRPAARAAQPPPNGMGAYIGFRCALDLPARGARR